MIDIRFHKQCFIYFCLILFYFDCYGTFIKDVNSRTIIYRNKDQKNFILSCVLCQDPLETVNHLFFEYACSAQIWKTIMSGVMKDQYTVDQNRLVRLITRISNWSIAKYMFQSIIHTIWREKNIRKMREVLYRPTNTEIDPKYTNRKMNFLFVQPSHNWYCYWYKYNHLTHTTLLLTRRKQKGKTTKKKPTLSS